jgi:hypothetical protein
MYDPHERHRRNMKQRLTRQILVSSACFLVLALVYNFGQTQGSAEFHALKNEASELRSSKEALEKDNVNLRAETMTAQTRLAELQQQYRNDIGDDNLRTLNRLLHERLASGVKPERLQQVIAATSNVRNCSSPESKRFIVTTPISKKDKSEISFGSGLITISGSGASAVNSNGGKESWFDPQQPVNINIAVRGGEAIKKVTTLPLQYSVIQGATEYRLTINASARSYAEVTADQCAYP